MVVFFVNSNANTFQKGRALMHMYRVTLVYCYIISDREHIHLIQHEYHHLLGLSYQIWLYDYFIFIKS